MSNTPKAVVAIGQSPHAAMAKALLKEMSLVVETAREVRGD
ncbi:hypothetical protein [Rhodoferax sp.]|nr:hypothetical protein [Rhodoferax sp.]